MSEQPHELLEKDHRACAQGLEEWEVLDPKNKDFQLLALWNCLWVKWIFFKKKTFAFENHLDTQTHAEYINTNT